MSLLSSVYLLLLPHKQTTSGMEDGPSSPITVHRLKHCFEGQHSTVDKLKVPFLSSFGLKETPLNALCF